MTSVDEWFQRHLDRVTAPFAGDVYVVLELDGSAAGAVMSVRRRYAYDYLGALPVEITVTGSSGVGSPTERGDPRARFSALDSIAAETPPIHGRLGAVHRFPETDVFVLQLKDPEPVLRLHDRIKNSGVAFDTSPFEFFPHCTLSEQQDPTDEDVQALLEARIDMEFTASTLSVYEIEAFPLCTLRYRGYLTG